MNRAARRTKDRKRSPGARINHALALKPLGMKDTKYELDARTALVALKHNVHNQQHLVDLYVLAEITEKLSAERYIKVHADSVRRLVNKAHEDGRLERMDYLAIETSADMLIGSFRAAKNADVARVCLEAANVGIQHEVEVRPAE